MNDLAAVPVFFLDGCVGHASVEDAKSSRLPGRLYPHVTSLKNRRTKTENQATTGRWCGDRCQFSTTAVAKTLRALEPSSKIECVRITSRRRSIFYSVRLCCEFMWNPSGIDTRYTRVSMSDNRISPRYHTLLSRASHYRYSLRSTFKYRSHTTLHAV